MIARSGARKGKKISDRRDLLPSYCGRKMEALMSVGRLDEAYKLYQWGMMRLTHMSQLAAELTETYLYLMEEYK